MAGNLPCSHKSLISPRRFSAVRTVSYTHLDVYKRQILHLIQRVRDEAHRFAVTFHRTRRNAARLTSELDQIPMVGEKTVRKLLKHFGSSELVRVAPENDLAALVGRAVAKRVRTFYDGNRTTV